MRMKPAQRFELKADYAPAGDQPQAIERLVEGLESGLVAPDPARGHGQRQDLHDRLGHRSACSARPWCSLTTRRWPRSCTANCAISSRTTRSSTSCRYYDYYQPEAYVPSSDTYIEKDASINEHIEQMRLSATKALLERPDAIIVATVSSIYGLGDPQAYLVDGAAPGARRAHRPAAAAAAPGRDAVHAQRRGPAARAPTGCAATSSTSSRPSPRARRCGSSCSTKRSRTSSLIDPLTGCRGRRASRASRSIPVRTT